MNGIRRTLVEHGQMIKARVNPWTTRDTAAQVGLSGR
jgi:hypothetical protein